MFILFLFLFNLAGTGIASLWKTISADGKVTHCYVDGRMYSDRPVDNYIIKGYVPWRSNVVLGTATDPIAADDLLKKVCPVKP